MMNEYIAKARRILRLPAKQPKLADPGETGYHAPHGLPEPRRAPPMPRVQPPKGAPNDADV